MFFFCGFIEIVDLLRINNGLLNKIRKSCVVVKDPTQGYFNLE